LSFVSDIIHSYPAYSLYTARKYTNFMYIHVGYYIRNYMPVTNTYIYNNKCVCAACVRKKYT